MSFRLILVVAPSFVRERLLCGTSVIQTCGSVFLNTHLYALVFLNPQQLSTRASIISPPRTESLPRFTAMMEPPAFLSVFN